MSNLAWSSGYLCADCGCLMGYNIFEIKPSDNLIITCTNMKCVKWGKEFKVPPIVLEEVV